jgi:predicted RNase H-like HicB family nuclease
MSRENSVAGALLYGIIFGKRCGGDLMETKLKMVYWKSGKFWVGKLLEHPEIMTQGETLEELEENMRDAYLLMAMEDVPEDHEVRELALKI